MICIESIKFKLNQHDLYGICKLIYGIYCIVTEQDDVLIEFNKIVIESYGFSLIPYDFNWIVNMCFGINKILIKFN